MGRGPRVPFHGLTCFLAAWGRTASSNCCSKATMVSARRSRRVSRTSMGSDCILASRRDASSTDFASSCSRAASPERPARYRFLRRVRDRHALRFASHLGIDRFVMHLARDHLDVVARELALAGEVARQQHPVAHRIDASRNSGRRLENALVGPGLKLGIALPADALQPVLDVAPRLVDIQRSDVAGGDHALAQLQHLRALHRAPEFRLTDEEALQQRVRLELEIRQHAQLLDRARREVLRFVDDEQRALPLLAHRDEEGLERKQQIRFFDVLRAQSERRCHETQRVFGVDLRADEVACDDLLRVELVEQAAHDRGLAGPHVAGDDDEPFILMQPVFEIRHGAPVLPAAEVEGGIRIELEGFPREPVEGFVHALA